MVVERRGRAVVLGASVAGLSAAHALVSRFDEVVVVERHPGAAGRAADAPGRSVVPQGEFPHVLLAGGARALEALVPGFSQQLFDRGALGDTDRPRPCHWWASGAVRRHVPDLGVRIPMSSRGLVEAVLRHGLGRHPAVTLLDGVGARQVVVRDGVVRGVVVGRGRDVGETAWDLGADLVVDATGRASRGPLWWEPAATGPDAACRVTRIVVDLVYTTVEVRRDPADLDGALFCVVQNSASSARLGVALPTETGRWKIVLGGYFGDGAPLDRAGMLDFARSLPDDAVARLLEKEWVSEPRRHRFPASERRRWSRLPAGYLPLGDAVASFNPVYGQGMSSAAMQAASLAAVLDRHGNRPDLPARALRQADRVVDGPWRIASGADFVYPQTVGARPRGTDRVNRYLERVFAAAADDEVVNRAVSRVQQLLAAPPSLMSPRVAARVLRRPRPFPVPVRARVGAQG